MNKELFPGCDLSINPQIYDARTRMMHMQDGRWEFMSNQGDRLVFRKDSKILVLTKVMLLYDFDNDCHCVFGFCHDKELFSIKFGLLRDKVVDSQ